MFLKANVIRTKVPVSIREYEVPMSAGSDSDEETDTSREVKEIFIEGYKIVFDKKVMLTPLEVIAIN